MEIGKYRNQLYWCSKCAYCRDTISDELGYYKVCPIYEFKRMEHFSPRGRATIALAALEGYLPLTQPLVDLAFSCLGCGICKAICPSAVDEGVDVAGIMRAMRQDLLNVGLKPPEAVIELDKNIAQTHNVFGEDSAKRTSWSNDLELPDKGDILYFAGCYTSYRYPETARATVKILEQAGIHLSYLGDEEWCCGVPQLWDGNSSLARDIARRNFEAIKKSGAKTVVATCAGCYHALNSNYREIVGEIPFEIVHVSTLLADLIAKDKIRLRKPIEKVLTYHDPCHLGRHEKIYDAPRDVIKNIPQIDYREMLRSKNSAWCCGGGAIESAVFPNLTKEISKARIGEAKEIGADALITSCPLCITILNRVAKPQKIQVYDLPVIVAEAMGLEI